VSDPVKITSFELTLHLSATVSVNGEAWVKPGVSSALTWNGLPTEEEIHNALQLLETKILSPTMDEVINLVVENTKRAKGIDGTNPYGR
jgi:hypothetical protein